MQFKHIAVVTKALDASVRFYETVPELVLLRRYREGDAELAFLANAQGETEIELVSMPGMQTFEGKGFFLCFLTDKLDEKHAFVKAQGYAPSEIRNPDAKSRYFYVYDPNGISVQIKQRFDAGK